ncbi:hypothetical protein EDI_135150 [Entamoeba dispar SAW760]|uniref:Uncharacterized protein n=1 Tax=Entamoeba dispar (strain ATCC PRA-260 / SAW760) TaxID=370354 RepID=B0EEE8_ENTDS|nr:uncharacterized protein EDI_135150 [Entamoeba dispar SAW760]EDR27062.1 hypothetical protein EDI_135150 [Entamoeba dispar SAW760]|eukprot:EDR27062.1 hypothetical protein EDI_135150 [Entamoeba dispar SAW760]
MSQIQITSSPTVINFSPSTLSQGMECTTTNFSTNTIEDSTWIQSDMQKIWDDSDPWISQILSLQQINNQNQTQQVTLQTQQPFQNIQQVYTQQQPNLFNKQLIQMATHQMVIDHINQQNEIIFENELTKVFDSIKNSTKDIELIKYKCKELISSIYLQNNPNINQNRVVKMIHDYAFSQTTESEQSYNDNNKIKNEIKQEDLIDNKLIKKQKKIKEEQNEQKTHEQNETSKNENNCLLIDGCDYPFVYENPYLSDKQLDSKIHELDIIDKSEHILIIEASLQRNKDQKKLWIQLAIKLNYEERDDIALKALKEAEKCTDNLNDEMKEIYYENSLSILFNTDNKKLILSNIQKKYQLTTISLQNESVEQKGYNILQELESINNNQCLYDKAILNLIIGDGETAAHYFEQLWEIKGSIEWNRIGVAYELSFRHQEAINCFLNALEIDQQNARIHNNLGLSYQGLNMWTEAVEHYCESLLIAEGNDTWDLLYVGLLMCGYDDLAERCKEENRDSMVISDVFDRIHTN